MNWENLVVGVVAILIIGVFGGFGSPFDYYAFMAGAVLAFLLIYFAPSLLAYYTESPELSKIVTINLFSGWTFVGWVVAWLYAGHTSKRPV